jgi:hypothetical protein
MKLRFLLYISAIILNLCVFSAHAVRHVNPNVGKPVYCDTSGGRSVLNNGSYSQLYCRYNAVMDFQTIHGCCSWAGGVLAVKEGNVICRDYSISEICSLQNHEDEFELRTDASVELDEEHW